MREIIFRGKSGTEWVYGDLWRLHEGRVAIRRNDKVLPYEVIPETVGQYTGLMDKNGGMIFEGDICKHRSNYSGNAVISVVTYTDGHFLALTDEHSGFELSEKLEVIGNIHDNPELLKGE